MKYFLIFLLAGVTLFSCKETYPDLVSPMPLPSPPFMLILENNQRLPDATLNRLKMVYFEGGYKRDVRDFGRATDAYDSLGILITTEMAFTSADKGIKDFYLEYPDGDVDTIFADYRRVSTKEAFESNCACYFPLSELKFNGITMQPDSAILDYWVYVFRK